jgi:hypothetical protein
MQTATTFVRRHESALMKKMVITVSQTSVIQAEHAIEACQQCSPASAVSFARVLHSFRRYKAGEVDYILPVLARCPACFGEIDESTLVKPKQDLSSRTPL